jgi:phospholipid transport system substrate-binding protein
MVLSTRGLKIIGTLLALALMGAWPELGYAAGAADELRPAVDKVLRILADPELKGEERTRDRRAALRAAMENAIDFSEAARRALAVHWRTRTDAERDEFVTLFKQLVIHSYIRVMEPYAGETVQFAGESPSNDTTTVLTRIHRRQGEPVPVDYRMHRRGTRWLVYDVVVEGVSLVGNYRGQFNAIIQTSSYEDLVRRIRARVAELDHAPAAAIGTLPRAADATSAEIVGAIWNRLHGKAI